jgi:hypothetical protein
VAHYVKGLSKAARREYQLGLAQSIYGMIEKNANSALDAAANPARSSMRLKLEAAFRDNPEAAKRLAAVWEARNALRKNDQFATGGSVTAEKLMDQVQASALPGRVGQISYAPVRGLASLIGEYGVRQLQRGLADETASRMTIKGSDINDFVRYLSQFSQRDLERQLARQRGTLGAIGAGYGSRDR